VIKRAQHLLRLRIDSRLRPLGLNAGLWSLLLELAQVPGSSASELARAAFQTPQTVGGLIQRLEDRGLVERTEGRGRIVENRVTPVGQEVLERATAEVEAIMSGAVGGRSDDADDLARLLGAFVREIGTVDDERRPPPFGVPGLETS
jgi:DNA-binding MarR family transcriptional regulator